jgi:hypothetical protein
MAAREVSGVGVCDERNVQLVNYRFLDKEKEKGKRKKKKGRYELTLGFTAGREPYGKGTGSNGTAEPSPRARL